MPTPITQLGSLVYYSHCPYRTRYIIHCPRTLLHHTVLDTLVDRSHESAFLHTDLRLYAVGPAPAAAAARVRRFQAVPIACVHYFLNCAVCITLSSGMCVIFIAHRHSLEPACPGSSSSCSGCCCCGSNGAPVLPCSSSAQLPPGCSYR